MNYYRMFISSCLNVHWIKEGYEIYYQFRCDCKIQCPLMAYCKEKNFEVKTMVFEYDGKILLLREP